MYEPHDRTQDEKTGMEQIDEAIAALQGIRATLETAGTNEDLRSSLHEALGKAELWYRSSQREQTQFREALYVINALLRAEGDEEIKRVRHLADHFEDYIHERVPNIRPACFDTHDLPPRPVPDRRTPIEKKLGRNT
jgi:hypothetical protein